MQGSDRNQALGGPDLPGTTADLALPNEAAVIFEADGRLAADGQRPLGTRRLPGVLVPIAIVGIILILAGSEAASSSRPTAGPSLLTDTSVIPAGAGRLGFQARASGQTGESEPGFAIDGNVQTSWNAGTHPPAWIEVELVAATTVTSISLLVEQNPRGPTVHRVLVATGDGQVELVHTFDGVTESGQWLTFTPDDPMPTVKVIRIETVTSPSWVAWNEIVVSGP